MYPLRHLRRYLQREDPCIRLQVSNHHKIVDKTHRNKVKLGSHI